MLRSLLSFLLIFSWFAANASAARASISVVATTPDLAAIAQAVGGSRVSVRSLSLPTQDPHWVDAKPSLALDLSHAELLLVVGAELELGWLPTLQVGSRNGRIQNGARGFLDCSELVELLERPAGKIDRSKGDVHPTGNPHYLLDPRAAERVAVGLGKRLSELDPEGTSAYLERTKSFVTSLRQARARWEKQLEPLRGRQVIAYHRSLVYLARWAGFGVLGHVEPKPGTPPDPRHVAELIARARQKQARLVLQEEWHPTSTSELIAKKLGGKLVRLPGGTNFQAGQSYIDFLDRVVKALIEAP
jgi:zinc/manganese transport system substrate-binding protein